MELDSDPEIDLHNQTQVNVESDSDPGLDSAKNKLNPESESDCWYTHIYTRETKLSCNEKSGQGVWWIGDTHSS